MNDPRRPAGTGSVTTSEPPKAPPIPQPEPEVEPEVRVDAEPEVVVDPEPDPEPEVEPEVEPQVRIDPEPEAHSQPARAEPRGVTVPPDEADTVELARSDLEEAARAAGVEMPPHAAPGDQEHAVEDPAEPDLAAAELPAGGPIDPRIRERRVAVTRAEGRRRLRVLLTVVSVASLLGIAWLVVQSPFLALDTVTITGTDHQTSESVRQAVGVSDGSALLFVDTGAVARRIEELPWVARAKVVRDLPSDLKITVVERLPMAWVRRLPPAGSPRGSEGPAAIVDATGRILGDEPAPPIGIPELVGTKRVGAAGTRIAPAGPAGAVSRIPRPLLRQVGSVTVEDGAAELILATPPGGVEPAAGKVKLGRLVDVTAKGAAALAVLDQLAAEGTHVSYIDVRVPGAPATR